MPQQTYQPRLDEALADPLAVDLSQVTFVVLDLETTGGSPDGAGITEIGAVKVRGGQVLGEFATLVNPGSGIPPFITVLTGITQAMVAEAPPIQAVLPSLLEFLGPAVLVAHNAPYDVGFLKAACAAHGHRWPRPVVLDTAALARRVLLPEEVRDRRLATLAQHFHTSVRPTHRALDDARATVEVLHGLIGRLGGYKVHTLRDTVEFVKAVSPVQRRKRTLAEGLPHAPGVYLFRGADDQVLYVGTSGDIATRVRSYFTAAERRARIKEMLAAAERVEAVECAHALEAQVRELRLIEAHAPPTTADRRSTADLVAQAHRRAVPSAVAGALPRRRRRPYLGPFGSRQAAEGRPPGSTTRCRCGQCTARLSRSVTPPPARWPSWAGAPPPASNRSRWTSTRGGWSTRCATRSPGTREWW